MGGHTDATRGARLLPFTRVSSVPAQADQTADGAIAALRPEKVCDQLSCSDVRRRCGRWRSAGIRIQQNRERPDDHHCYRHPLDRWVPGYPDFEGSALAVHPPLIGSIVGRTRGPARS